MCAPALALVLLIAAAESPAQQTDPITVLGVSDGPVLAVDRAEGRLWHGSGTRLYTTLDGDSLAVDTPGLELPGVILDLKADHTRVWAALGEAGICGADTDPQGDPQALGCLDTPGVALALELLGDLLLVADDTVGLLVVSVADPMEPQALGGFPAPEATDLDANGPILALADGTSGVRLLDLGDPSQPFEQARVDTDWRANGVSLADTLVWVADDTGGLLVLDAHPPEDLAPVGGLDTPGIARRVEAREQRLLLASSNTLSVYDTAEPAVPLLLGSLSAAVQGMQWSGDTLWLAEGSGGLSRVDLSDPAQPERRVRRTCPGAAGAVVLEGDLAFVACGSRGLQVFSLEDETRPRVIGEWDGPGNAVDLVLQGNLLLLANDHSGLAILDVSNPSLPVQIGNWATDGDVYGVALDGNTAWLAAGSAGLVAVDLTLPDQPQWLAQLPSPGFAWDVSAAGGLVAVAAAVSGLQVVDGSNPAQPAELAVLPLPGNLVGVELRNGLAWLAAEDQGLLIVDLSSPDLPALVGQQDTPGMARRIALAGDLALVADRETGLRVIHAGDPGLTYELTAMDSPGSARGVAVSGDRVALADGNGGLRLYRVDALTGLPHEPFPPATLPQGFTLHPVHPNPFNPSTTVSYTLARPLQAELSVYNLLGQQVRTLAFGLQDAGEHSVPFTAGELSSGLYVVELKAGGHSQTQKVLLLK